MVVLLRLLLVLMLLLVLLLMLLVDHLQHLVAMEEEHLRVLLVVAIQRILSAVPVAAQSCLVVRVDQLVMLTQRVPVVPPMNLLVVLLQNLPAVVQHQLQTSCLQQVQVDLLNWMN